MSLRKSISIDKLSDDQILELWKKLLTNRNWVKFWEEYYQDTGDYSLGPAVTQFRIDKGAKNPNVPTFKRSIILYYKFNQ